MSQTFQNDQINNIMAKCWVDPSFKQQFLADPAAVLKAEGVEIPAGYTVRVLENAEKLVNFVLPRNPNGDLSDSELESVAGGSGWHFDPERVAKGIEETVLGTAKAVTGIKDVIGGVH